MAPCRNPVATMSFQKAIRGLTYPGANYTGNLYGSAWPIRGSYPGAAEQRLLHAASCCCKQAIRWLSGRDYCDGKPSFDCGGQHQQKQSNVVTSAPICNKIIMKLTTVIANFNKHIITITNRTCQGCCMELYEELSGSIYICAPAQALSSYTGTYPGAYIYIYI